MALAPGTRLGPYEVVAAIGAGGMGEVYRARDTSLNRDVAIKVLPDALAHDAERLARFQREAELLAALNHSNIAQIYGLDRSSDRPALILEFVEGPTLSDRIRSGPLPLAEALVIARQIADALEAAHEQGIIHRDLKPANIKVRADDTVKVLDFGLAKALEPVIASSHGAEVSTITSPALTERGVILGTAAYMSPEQAKGRGADRRSDVWAFGAVLYEMLSGRRPFEGEDVSDTLANVLKQDPAWDALPPDVPPRVRRVIQVCLAKSPKERFSDFQDVRLALEGRFEVPSAAGTAPRHARTRIAAAFGAIGLIAVFAGWIVGVSAGQKAPASPLRRFPLVLSESQSLPRASGTLVALSPNGQTLVYGASEGGTKRLYARSLTDLEALPIPGTENAAEPFFSLDGQWVVFRQRGTLFKVRLPGGRSTAVADVGDPEGTWGGHGGTWAPDNTIILAGRAGLLRVPAAGGRVETLLAREKEEPFWYPQVLPNGRAVLFTASDPRRLEASRLMLLDLGTGRPHKLLDNALAGQYGPNGHLAFVRDGSLWAVRFDLDHLEVRGDPVPVEQGVRVESGGAVQFAVARDGSLAFIPDAGDEQRSLVWVDRKGHEEAIPAPPKWYRYIRLSPDGTRVAAEVLSQHDTSRSIWIWDLARGVPMLLDADCGGPVWVPPDWTRLACANSSGIYEPAADGTGTRQLLMTMSGRTVWPRAFSADGKLLLVSEAGSPADISILRLDGASRLQGLIVTPSDETNPEISPDGNWIAYQSKPQSNESTRPEVYVQPFPNVDTRRWQVSSDGGTRPLWNPNGGELFYVAPSGSLMSVLVETTPTFKPGRAVEAVPGYAGFLPPGGGGLGRFYDVSPDGRRFILSKKIQAESSPQPTIVLVQNWFGRVKQLLPPESSWFERLMAHLSPARQ